MASINGISLKAMKSFETGSDTVCCEKLLKKG